MVIAIDGPAGAGKSSVARAAAERLGFTYLDTGAMYRAVALRTGDGGGDPAEIARTARLELGERVTLDGEDVTERIREPRVSDRSPCWPSRPADGSWPSCARRTAAWASSSACSTCRNRPCPSTSRCCGRPGSSRPGSPPQQRIYRIEADPFAALASGWSRTGRCGIQHLDALERHLDARDGQQVDAYAEPAPEGWVLVVGRDLQHPPGAVWAALTEPERLRAWAPFTGDRDLGATGPATLTMVDGVRREGRPAVTVTTAERPTVLEYTWGSDDLRWELAAAGGGTRLTLRHRVGSREDLARSAAGWRLCLAVPTACSRATPCPRSAARTRSSTAGPPCTTGTPPSSASDRQVAAVAPVAGGPGSGAGRTGGRPCAWRSARCRPPAGTRPRTRRRRRANAGRRAGSARSRRSVRSHRRLPPRPRG